MRAYGRWQGYAWSVVVVASGTAYALSLGLRRESGRRANDVDDDGGGGGGRGFDSVRTWVTPDTECRRFGREHPCCACHALCGASGSAEAAGCALGAR